MVLHNRQLLTGRMIRIEYASRVLRDNPLKDPSDREVWVYLPPQYDSPRYRNKRFPVLFDLVGYTGSGLSHIAWRNFDESVPEQIDRLIQTGRMAPAIVVFPDCFTALGGNQYINSSAIGDYATYLTRELIPFIDRSFRTKAAREHRGCFGKSSGGYGAMVHGLRYAKYWGAIANHSGDAYFDFVYKAEWPAALTELQRDKAPKPTAGRRNTVRGQNKPGQDDGRIERFLQRMWQTTHPSGKEITALMMVCMAATYDPDPKAPLGFRVPYDLETGVLLPARWRRWLRHDPIHMVGQYKANLQTLRGIYIDCGWRDQYHIHFGTRQLSQVLHKHRIKHRYEEFDGSHSGIDHRMDVSLPFLTRALR